MTATLRFARFTEAEPGESVLICEIREIRGQKLFHARPWVIEDQRRLVFHALVTLGCGRSPRQEQLVQGEFRSNSNSNWREPGERPSRLMDVIDWIFSGSLRFPAFALAAPSVSYSKTPRGPGKDR